MQTTRQTYHEELGGLERLLLQMGTLAIDMVTEAVESLKHGDLALSEKVIANDDVVDGMDQQIEALCMRLLALQQPMAKDLRKIGTAMKVITDLERIGDHAVDIAKISRKMVHQFFISKPLVDVSALGEMTTSMLRNSLEALVRHDTNLAKQICVDDDRVDDEFKALREQLLSPQREDISRTAASAYMLLAVVALERIADHATNIAERVYYIETGHMEHLARAHRLEGGAPPSGE
ncbi:phosphate transport system regulatory protein PhoU [Capsulimonas corticalis]|uniref:Phosphate-specific transport system accessory protein PhoU n=1 Tax=Capsulimonas corticalis TaxID=2219043 RepID=A0A402D3K8_9BACT|nr:phosphate signaling complex protein PhoU [Capsulimonas corticalis]BDI31900.1 phosphate transport system regulatory protein PhoU [Capsulimonas corticalis]